MSISGWARTKIDGGGSIKYPDKVTDSGLDPKRGLTESLTLLSAIDVELSTQSREM